MNKRGVDAKQQVIQNTHSGMYFFHNQVDESIYDLCTHEGFILHKKDADKLDHLNLFEIKGDRRMKYMNVIFSVRDEDVSRVKYEIRDKEKLPGDLMSNYSIDPVNEPE